MTSFFRHASSKRIVFVHGINKLRRWHSGASAIAKSAEHQDEENENFVQTSSVAYYEVLLCHKSEPRCKGPKTVGSKDWFVEKSSSGIWGLPGHRKWTFARRHFVTMLDIFPQVWFQNARAKWRRNLMRQESGQSQQQPGTPGSTTSLSVSSTNSIDCPSGLGSSVLINENNGALTPQNLEEIHQLHHSQGQNINFSDIYWCFGCVTVIRSKSPPPPEKRVPPPSEHSGHARVTTGLSPSRASSRLTLFRKSDFCKFKHDEDFNEGDFVIKI